jgi:GntR family transcriptional regulator of arabinose operon
MSGTKYRGIVEWAKNEIAQSNLSPGDKFFSETELCAIHHVSRQTVRQALAVLDRQGILFRKQGSGTFISAPQAVARQKNRTVGIISTYFNDYIFPSIITGIENVLSKNDIAISLATTSNQVTDEAKALATMLAQNVDGLIVEPSKSALPSPNMALYNEIKVRNIPLVFFNAKYPWADFPCVAMDDVAAGKIAADYLFSLGHTDIAGIFVFDNMQGHKRYNGFIKSLEENKILLSEHRILWYSTQEQSSFFIKSKDKIRAVIENSTAIVCYNDSIAVQMLAFCREHGVSVPDDISIIGIDDSNISRICEVPLTSVRHPKQKLGEAAAETLLEIMDGTKRDSADVLFVPPVAARDSTAVPPPAHRVPEELIDG